MKNIYKGLLVGSVLVSAACASAPAPTERMSSAKASVRAAQEVGAANVPQAQLHVQLAQEQLEKARKLSEDGENERADMMLRRASIDAELALALAREATSRDQATSAEQNAGPSAAAPAADAREAAVR